MSEIRIERSAIVPYSPKQMYDLVNDIPSYPKFLPWCRSAKVLSQADNQICACLDVAKGAVQRSFSTCNNLQPNQRIEMHLKEGPFKDLFGLWQFEDIQGRGSKVSLTLSFEFSNKILELALSPVFCYMANNMVDAFQKRAQQVYGQTFAPQQFNAY